MVDAVNGLTVGGPGSLVRFNGTEYTWGVDYGVQDMRAAKASHVRGVDKYILDNRNMKMDELYTENKYDSAHTYTCATIADEKASHVFAC